MNSCLFYKPIVINFDYIHLLPQSLDHTKLQKRKKNQEVFYYSIKLR